MTNIYQQLSESFPQEMERNITKSGVSLVYIPVSEVINRLNKVLGVDKWSFTIVECKRDSIDPDYVVAHVRIDWYQTDFACVSRDGFGGQKIKRTKAGAIVDLGDEFKGAMSDAFKKACQGFGVGLELARTDDALAAEEAHYGSDDITETPASAGNAMADAVSAETWKKFQVAMKELSDDEKAAVREWWMSNYGDSGNPSADISTEDQIAALNATISLIRLGAETVED